MTTHERWLLKVFSQLTYYIIYVEFFTQYFLLLSEEINRPDFYLIIS